MVDLGITETYR